MEWNFFDSIRCINLKNREDRHMNSSYVFNKHKIPVEYYHVDKHPNGGLQGCFESHIQLVTEAYNNNLKNIVIFEDDITDTKYLTKRNIRKIIRFLKNNDWDIFFLGPHPDIRRFSTDKTKISNIYKINSICGHAYILNRNYIKLMANTKFNGTPLDYLYKFNNKSYGHIPSLFIQGSSVSDISGDLFNRIPILKIGSIKFVEFYSTTINIKLPYLLSILILILFYTSKKIKNIYINICLFICLLFVICLLLCCK
tara:strand:- start:96 stop:860 length:765 start_codon:yes stop_codon:yes gene_type:complete